MLSNVEPSMSAAESASRDAECASRDASASRDAGASRDEGASRDAESACRYIEERVRKASGHRWLQGPLVPPLPTSGLSAPPSVRLFAEHRLHRVPSAAARALVAWSRGERRVDLLAHVPTARDVLALQSKGRRCVSLLPEGASTAPHADGLAFALHDLCHLEKFVDPDHHEAQVGFFALVFKAISDPAWSSLEAGLDAQWIADRDHVIADMNGSAVFLLLALKSKLKVAVRRRVARDRGDDRAQNGPLDAAEQRRWTQAMDALLELLELRGAAADAAIALSEKGGTMGAEITLHACFREAGVAVLGAPSCRRV